MRSLAGFVRPDLPFVFRASPEDTVSGIATITRFVWRGRDGFALISHREVPGRAAVTSNSSIWYVLAGIRADMREDLPHNAVWFARALKPYRNRIAAWVAAPCIAHVLERIGRVPSPYIALRPAAMTDEDERAMALAVSRFPVCPAQRQPIKMTLAEANKIVGAKWDDSLDRIYVAFQVKMREIGAGAIPEEGALVRFDALNQLRLAFVRQMVQRWRHRRPVPVDWLPRMPQLDRMFPSKAKGQPEE
jgi:hypothetical protein